MSVVCDTGPLIALTKVDRLDLLEQLFGTVEIPPAVHRELLAKVGPEAGPVGSGLVRFSEYCSFGYDSPDNQRRNLSA
jgi:predicted nucleic acid-binding protein